MKKNLLLGLLTFIAIPAFAESLDRVLLLGDSHAYGKYGEVLDSHFRATAKQVTSFSSCGSSPSTWTTTSANFKSTNCGFWKKNAADRETRVKSHKLPSFNAELKSLRPQLTVITLGTNILGSTGNINSEKKHIESMMKAIRAQGSECVWVGPPDLAKTPFSKNLQSGVATIKALADKNQCHFIDSTKLTQYPSGKSDGIHYGPGDSANWGKAVIEKIKGLNLKAPQRTAPPAPAAPNTPAGVR
ncbi:SGNH/GDSL hydrolase family protein [Bdellovibrio bacteriovorus]|uniref:SGNH/GDSL hydrolase family protein n=1 Tax=Bdellovibrio bacteriovorus TaxID=959 RepID=UPI0021D2B889|nr:SGNH/GDSL hydrolase family protein [Bdellovibrio bacteriovorus]UXR63208.1 SGNH/GDSL hydrolase family protein [Bdellovibrio bacteriovorus]